MYCTCGKQGKAGYTASKELDSDEFNYDLWVCANCLKPSRLIFENICAMLTPRNAISMLGAHGGADGIWTCVWSMPDGTRKTTMHYSPYPRIAPDMMDQGRGYLLQLWKLLDEKCQVIMKYDPLDNMIKATAREHAQHEARGLSEAISILMYQFYPTANDVVKESVRRFKARESDTEYESPGLAESLWDPKSRFRGTTFEKVPSANLKAGKALTPEEIQGIKDAVKSEMFTEADMASMFKVSVTQIREAVAS